ncbi:MAG: thiamine pyrophosphate-binding protein [Ferruginibacter sp.]|nr:thiamine pyrophosphate-binding protein [Ferruginibacter sp.]
MSSAEKNVSDLIAEFLAERGIKHVFGIIGAGNVRLFEAISKLGFTEIICVHHEQAACMAMQTYFRINGQVTACLLTTGAGSTNGITGVVGAWADSIPGVIISGNENSKHVSLDNPLRMYGVQGYDSTGMVKDVCKFVSRVSNPKNVLITLNQAFKIAREGRPGPCWIDIPMDMQSIVIKKDDMLAESTQSDLQTNQNELEKLVDQAISYLAGSERPVLWLGHGIRLANAQHLIMPLVDLLKIPVLISWAGIDMIDSDNEFVHGRAGVYGQRNANFVLQNSDLVIAIGTRLAIPQIGYDTSELVRSGKIIHVDIDANELSKNSSRINLAICADAKAFLEMLLLRIKNNSLKQYNAWNIQCNQFRKDFPWVNRVAEHKDSKGFINSYAFVEKLNCYFKARQIVVTDMGTALLCGHQVLKLKEGQRLMTSSGLGEMGFGLPAAIGASFASNKGEVLCLNCDGGMMMNLQELQTIAHHQLPIKIIVFNNDGYLMIKHTQKALFGKTNVGTDRKSGVSCPDFSKVAAAFGFKSFQIRTWEDCDKIIPEFQNYNGPTICEVFMDPMQAFHPKLSLKAMPDGTLISPPLEDLAPFLPRATLQKNMPTGVHSKSLLIPDEV